MQVSESTATQDAGVAQRVTHPLDPLTADEIRAVAQILRVSQGITDKHWFAQIGLREPDKEVVSQYQPGKAVNREAFVVVIDREKNQTFESVVSITGSSVISWEYIEGVQPAIILEEFNETEELVKSSPEFLKAMERRGITDVTMVTIDPWSAGSYGADERDKRRINALMWLRIDSPDDNAYAHPIDGLIAHVNLTDRTVDVVDRGVVSIPREPGNYVPELTGLTRNDLRPIEITQPEGPSYSVDGNEVRWHNWSLRIGFTQREGLVLHNVKYRDGEDERSVLYRGSLSSMLVPYGDPSPTQYRKNAFDIGEYHIGYLTNSLELGCDCLGEIRYFDADLSNGLGQPYTIKNAICMHEEDTGILWKHSDMGTGKAEVRRGRRLVISFIATFANYEYGFYWHLYPDGTIEHEVKLTGILTTAAVEPGERTKFGQLLNSDGLYAPVHQHFFSFRLDMDVDGEINEIYEVNARPAAPEDNPYGNAYFGEETRLGTELAAQRLNDSSTDRFWKVVNPAKFNHVGEPVAYRIMSPSSSIPKWSDTAHIAPRGEFISKQLWVTPFQERELYAAGDYPYGNPDNGGLPQYTAGDRSLLNEDLVVWLTLGVNHLPRLEDWPVMPVQHVRFKLEPHGFFDRNPTLDTPRPESAHCVSLDTDQCSH
ncbi:primary-amine oxidase [Arthrobacter globiformis]|uniref:primary-amine oxidase n=1 Tax=Arthrobacter globiformis TaxID=1665 RepID=UPI00278B6781|nr:primary-amine oxidase [Arthrobacter globiformis]MDQ0864526.1 primary-amine oxidase [Arthrobacter globiformis]